MEMDEAKEKINKLVGKDLRPLADHYGVTVFKGDKKNKGWFGHVIERYLNLPINSLQKPDFGSWELKTISLKYLNNGKLTVKETMAITMINESNVKNTEFDKSHLKNKLQNVLIVARIWFNQQETKSILQGAYIFDLSNTELYQQIKEDYDLVKGTVNNKGFHALTGKMGVYIQPRTKGPGHGSTSRAFYARTGFLKKITGIE